MTTCPKLSAQAGADAVDRAVHLAMRTVKSSIPSPVLLRAAKRSNDLRRGQGGSDAVSSEASHTSTQLRVGRGKPRKIPLSLCPVLSKRIRSTFRVTSGSDPGV